VRGDDTVIDMPRQEVHLASADDADVAFGRTDVRSILVIAAAIGPCAPGNGVHSPLWIEGAQGACRRSCGACILPT